MLGLVGPGVDVEIVQVERTRRARGPFVAERALKAPPPSLRRLTERADDDDAGAEQGADERGPREVSFRRVSRAPEQHRVVVHRAAHYRRAVGAHGHRGHSDMMPPQAPSATSVE